MSRLNGLIHKIDKITTLSEEIGRCRLAAGQLTNLEREYRETHEAITKELDSLDVANSGNFGWELRVVRFLAEFRQAAKATAQDKETDAQKGGE